VMPNDSIEQELDERHAAARDAFLKRDLNAYRAIFSASLRYRQANGKVIDRNRLMRDVASQFRQLSSVQSSFVREQLSVTGNEATETLEQSATVAATAFWLSIVAGIFVAEASIHGPNWRESGGLRR
jgi:hypothetical protein